MFREVLALHYLLDTSGNANVQKRFDSFRAFHDASEKNWQKLFMEQEISSSDIFKRNKDLDERQKSLLLQNDDLQKGQKKLQQQNEDGCKRREAEVKNLKTYTQTALLKEQVFKRKIDTLEESAVASDKRMKLLSNTIEDLNARNQHLTAERDEFAKTSYEQDLEMPNLKVRNVNLTAEVKHHFREEKYMKQKIVTLEDSVTKSNKTYKSLSNTIDHLRAERDWLQKTKYEQGLELTHVKVSPFFSSGQSCYQRPTSLNVNVFAGSGGGKDDNRHAAET